MTDQVSGSWFEPVRSAVEQFLAALVVLLIILITKLSTLILLIGPGSFHSCVIGRITTHDNCRLRLSKPLH